MQQTEIFKELRTIGTALKRICAVLETGATVEAKRSENDDPAPHANGHDDQPATGTVTAEASARRAKTEKKGKTAAAKPPEDENFDLGFGEETEPEAEAASHTLEDVIDAFKAYATKNSREKAGAILKKFNVKSVRDLKPDQFGKVLAALG
jgi:hypothetical protein